MRIHPYRLSALVAIVSLQTSLLPAQPSDTTRTREVEIESADVLIGDEVGGQSVYRLEGNVVLTQEETILRADRAVQYQHLDLIVFDGNVEIVDEGDTLWAEEIEYMTDVKTARASGNVVWTDGAVRMEAPAGEYRVDEKVASFDGRVIMRDSTTAIVSRSGEYRVEEEVAFFVDSVRLDQEAVTLTADSVAHWRESGLTVASGSVRIYRSRDDSAATRVVLLAGRAETHRETGSSRLWHDPILARFSASDSSADTLVVRAARLEATSSDSVESFQAAGRAEMWSADLAAVADSLRFYQAGGADDARILMTGRPALWSGESQVTGDTIRIGLIEGRPDSLTASPNAFVAFEDSATGRIQQIRGDRLLASFRGDSLRRLVVRPQAEALYFGDESAAAGDTTSKQKQSAVRFSSGAIAMEFSGGQVGRIVASTDVEGEILKFEPTGAPRLEGFSWRVEDRPLRQEMLTEALLKALSDWPAESDGLRPLASKDGTARP